VQTRPVTTIKKMEQATAEALPEIKAPVILSGAPASPGMAAGPVKIVADPSQIDKVKAGDILVAAIGKPAFVTADFIKPGATVIDVGINRLTTPEEIRKIYHHPEEPLQELEHRGHVLVGDVNPEDVRELAGAYTPVPGGVGPLTIAMLMVNTVQAARLRRGMRAVDA